jgi:hypothetical protein
VSNQIQAERCIAKPEFESFQIVNENLTMVKTRKTKIFWNKPTYIGFCVLELSKLVMYKFHYEYIIPTYKTNAKLLLQTPILFAMSSLQTMHTSTCTTN